MDEISLEKYVSTRGPLTLAQAIPVLEAICAFLVRWGGNSAVDRWCGPANIQLDKRGRPLISRTPEPSDTNYSKLLAAPEPLRDFDTGPAHVYWMASLTCWMMTGQAPPRVAEDGDRLQWIELPGELGNMDGDAPIGRAMQEVLRRALQPNPKLRPASPLEFLELIRDRKNFMGEYRLLERIGRGRTGAVYRAERAHDGHPVAVKLLDQHVAQDERKWLRFQQEARICREMQHPNIVHYYEIGKDRGRHFVVMELIEGVNLETYVRANERLSECEALRIASELGAALAALHGRQILHRDIQPANVMIGNEGSVKLLDLGLAKTEQDIGVTGTGYGMGAPPYIAPEQFQNAKQVGPGADIYGLGATLYWMVTGQPPFDDESLVSQLIAKMQNRYKAPERANRLLSKRTSKLIKQLMAARLDDRPQSIADVNRQLQLCAAGAGGADGEGQRGGSLFQWLLGWLPGRQGR